MQNRITPQISILEKFCAEILSSSLSPEVQQDALRIIYCLIFIETHMDYVIWAADHKEIAIHNQRDKKHGVLRDNFDTAFHLNSYSNGEEAKVGLQRLIGYVTTALEQLTVEERLTFAKKMSWDQNRGCLEARVAPALEWATTRQDSVTLDSVIETCVKDNNGDIPSIAFILAYCSRKKITQVDWDGRRTLVDIPLIQAYLKAVYDHEETTAMAASATPQPPSRPSGTEKKPSASCGITVPAFTEKKVPSSLDQKILPLEEKILTHTLKHAETRGKQGMWQYHFANKQQAEAFLKEVQTHPSLKHLEIHKAGIQEQKCEHSEDLKKCCIVRLSEKQREVLLNQTKQKTPTIAPPPSHSLLVSFRSAIQRLFSEKTVDITQEITLPTLVYDVIKGQQSAFDRNPSGVPLRIMSHQLKEWCASRKDWNVFEQLAKIHSADEKENHFAPLFKALSAASPPVINIALICQNRNNESLLQLAAKHQDAKAFEHLLALASKEAISQAIAFPAKDGSSVLQVAAEYQPSTAFRALIAKTFPDALNKTVAFPNLQGRCALHLAAEKQDSEAFQALVAHATPEAINKALRLEPQDDCNLLQIAAKHQNPIAFQALIAKATADTINHALLSKKTADECILRTAAHHPDSKTFEALITIATEDTINQALLAKQTEGWRILNVAAKYQSATVFQALLAKITEDTLNQIILYRKPNSWCVFYNVIRYQHSRALQALIAKLKTDIINEALLLEVSNGHLLLQIIAKHQDSRAFQALIEKSDPIILTQAFISKNTNHPSIFAHIAHYISPESMNVLLKHLKPSAAILDTFFSQDSSTFFSVLKKISLYKTGENIRDFLNLLDQEQLAARAKEIPTQLVADTTLFPALLALDTKLKSLINEEKTHESKPVNFHVLSKEYILNTFAQLKSERKMVMDEKEEEDEYSEEEKKLEQCFINDHAVVKIIRYTDHEDQLYSNSQDTHWNSFYHHLSDYTKRQDIRHPQKPTTGHKYIPTITQEEKEDKKEEKVEHDVTLLPKGKIVPFDLKKQQAGKINKKYKGTIKTPVTLISSDLTTAVFGDSSQTSSRELVGVVFNENKGCHFKMMLMQDRGTYYREWVDITSNNVIAYAQGIQHISHTNLKEYREAIAKQPYTVNEALAEVSRDAIQGIVIRKDTPRARTIAIQRMKELELLLKRKIPIIFYNPLLKNIRIFTKKEQLFQEDKDKIIGLIHQYSRVTCPIEAALKDGIRQLNEGPHGLQELFILLDDYLNNKNNLLMEKDKEAIYNIHSNLMARLREETDKRLKHLKKNAATDLDESSLKKAQLDILLEKITSLHNRGYSDGNTIKKTLALIEVYHLFRKMKWDDVQNLQETQQKINEPRLLEHLNTFSFKHGSFVGAWLKQAFFGRRYQQTMSNSCLIVKELNDYIGKISHTRQEKR